MTIRLYTGTMNSGKTTQLLLRKHAMEERQADTMIMKPIVDTKGGNCLSSRAISEEYPCILIETDKKYKPNMNFLKYEVEHSDTLPDVIYIDEVQFLTPTEMEEIFEFHEEYKINIEMYGLMADFKQEMFQSTKRAIELGVEIIRIETFCDVCIAPAVTNIRKLNGEATFEGEIIQIGKEETYSVLCYSCYAKEKKNWELKKINKQFEKLEKRNKVLLDDMRSKKVTDTLKDL